MIDTSHIDPHWPVDAQAQAAEQPPLPLDLGPAAPAEPAAVLTISKSEIATLRRCPRLYYFEYVLGRTPAKGPGIEAKWGTALHRGLEAWLHRRMILPGDNELDSALWEATHAGVDEDGRPYTPPADPYARAALRAMLRAYAAVWGPGDAERYEVIAVELPFDLPVLTAEGRVSRGRREGARREGRIDAMVRERRQPCPRCGGTGDAPEREGFAPCGPACAAQFDDTPLWIIEHKSTGKHPEDERWYVGIELELQPSLYFDAARELGHSPAGVIYDVIRRPDFDDPKPAPQRNKDGSERKAPSTGCDACYGKGTWICEWCKGEGKSVLTGEICGSCNGKTCFCQACAGTGRVTKQVSYTNPRHGEPAALYEERVYQLALARPTDFFHRRALTIEPWQVEESREDVRAAALEIAWRTRSQAWPRVGDRYVCGARGRVCPWLDVCGHVESAENDTLYPLKRKKESKST